ncbi:2-dehydropantoate 2-reductase [Ruegeria marisrubri]|uniref:2-dehydropantoate 2-reductase n=1 Tax=Ruegeria marisrubri TaxID=1685379 RepID=A0A0X3TC10_9RHOB|nr:2-dehydropantoate 2-reductase [Ruegeria marisrubri]KUJ73322.1 2-dehydropantoate 2-reductase [Ruegeria marisrubri]
MRIAIAGAGSIGCFCGGLLAAGGHDVTLLGRPRILDEIRSNGLTVSDYSGLRQTLAADRFTLTDDPAALGAADLVIVTVKSGATAAMADLIARHAPPSAPVLSWQNGMDNARTLRAHLPGRDLRAGMVPFNVVPTGPATWHRATSGDIIIETGAGDLARALSVPQLAVAESDRIEAVRWGKLLLNLNNALNALSGLTLREQLLDRDWRRLMADQMSEALGILKSAGIEVASTTPLPAWLVPHVLRLPTPLFSRIAARMLTIDPTARTSMAYDLMAGRPTEIDSLQGEIIRLAEQQRRPAPICARVAALVSEANADPGRSSGLRPAEIRP